jgi:hypothetical protein
MDVVSQVKPVAFCQAASLISSGSILSAQSRKERTVRIFIFLMALVMCATVPSVVSSRPLCASWKISQAFEDQQDTYITRDDSLNLPHAVEVYPYAIQPWNTAHRTGQTLFKYNPRKGWVLSSTGNPWTVASLVSQKKVPLATAKELMRQLQHVCN